MMPVNPTLLRICNPPAGVFGKRTIDVCIPNKIVKQYMYRTGLGLLSETKSRLMICMLMSDNKEIRFPLEANQKLNKASESQKNNIEIICGGTGLHWPDLDEDLSVTGIVEGRFG